MISSAKTTQLLLVKACNDIIITFDKLFSCLCELIKKKIFYIKSKISSTFLVSLRARRIFKLICSFSQKNIYEYQIYSHMHSLQKLHRLLKHYKFYLSHVLHKLSLSLKPKVYLQKLH